MEKYERALRKELVQLLTTGGAHATFEESIAAIPKKYYGAHVKGLPYTLWRLLNHMRISQRDVLDFITKPDYVEPTWPKDYWPTERKPESDAAWKSCIKQIRQDLLTLIELIENPKTKLFLPIPHMKRGPTILHQILLVADHNSYHIGQLILLRGLLGIWQD